MSAVHIKPKPMVPKVMQTKKHKVADRTDKLLQDRRATYGKFSTQAVLAQSVRAVFDTHMRFYNSTMTLTSVEAEALSMIFNKIGRIGNGNCHFEDSWRDIAGYATLVADYLSAVKEPV